MRYINDTPRRLKLISLDAAVLPQSHVLIPKKSKHIISNSIIHGILPSWIVQ